MGQCCGCIATKDREISFFATSSPLRHTQTWTAAWVEQAREALENVSFDQQELVPRPPRTPNHPSQALHPFIFVVDPPRHGAYPSPPSRLSDL